MAERVVVHIGSMKSGTSFIQGVLDHNRDRLREHGAFFAGDRWRKQVLAVQELITHGGPRQPDFASDGPFRSLVDEINATPGTGIVSMEFLGPRSRDKIDLLARHLDGRMDVVLTARDLARNITAMWQESVQNGSAVTWADYLQAVRAEDGSPVARTFWNHQGVASIAQRWSEAVGRERFTLMTVPPPGAPHSLLWERFASVVGLDPASFTMDVRANRSIGLSTAMVMRELNELLVADSDQAKAGDIRYYDLLVKHQLAKRRLPAAKNEAKLGLDASWVFKRGAAEVRRLKSQGHHVVGDLDELMPQRVPGIQPQDIAPSELHRATMDALVGMTQIAIEREGRHRTRLRRVKDRKESS